MAINMLKWLNFAEGTAICINEIYPFTGADATNLDGQFFSNISIDIPTIGNPTSLQLTDKNNHIWLLTGTRTDNTHVTWEIKIDGSSKGSVGSGSARYPYTTKAYLIFGYNVNASRYGLYLYADRVAGSSSSWACGFFLDGVSNYSENANVFPAPITIESYLQTVSSFGKYSYINLLPNGYAQAGGIGNDSNGMEISGINTVALEPFIISAYEDFPDVPPEDTDPYAPGGTSGPSSGSGTFDLTSDTISIPNLPTLSATNAGLVTVYVPNATQLNSFASLLFGRTFLDAFLNAITTLFVDPLEAVIGLSIVPVAPTLATARQVSVAFIGLTSDDGPLMMQPAATQYVEVDCGTIFIDEFSGSALDYSPYSKFHIYLPYIGTRELSTDEIRNKHLHVVYHVDIVSGSCVALLEVEGSVLYQFAGNCATPIPINGRDFSRMVTAGIQLAASFVGATAGAGVGAVAAGNIGKPDDYISTDSSFNTLIKTLDSDEGVTPSANKAAGGKVDAEHLVSSTAGVVAGMKSHIQHASGIGGSAGMLGVQKPYLIAEIPRQSLAADYNKFVGYPSNITSLLGDLTGFTQIEMIHLKGIPCTETELAEIDKMLRNGVIL